MFGLPDYKAGDETKFAITNNDPQQGKLDFRDNALASYAEPEGRGPGASAPTGVLKTPEEMSPFAATTFSMVTSKVVGVAGTITSSSSSHAVNANTATAGIRTA